MCSFRSPNSRTNRRLGRHEVGSYVSVELDALPATTKDRRRCSSLKRASEKHINAIAVPPRQKNKYTQARVLLTELANANERHDGDGHPEHGPAHDRLPLAGGRVHLDQGLTETRPIQLFLFGQSQCLPVSLFLLAQRLQHDRSHDFES